MKVYAFYGGSSGFSEYLDENGCEDYETIVNLALRDDARNRKIKVDVEGRQVDEQEEDLYYANVVAFSDDYAAISESAIESFTNLVFRYDIDNLYLQNPPDSIVKHIKEITSVDFEDKQHIYKVLDMDMLKRLKKEFPEKVIGQEIAQAMIVEALYNVAKRRYDKPCVMLFYGSTGIGKTESAKFISEVLKEKLFRKQFSMLHSEEFSSYVFGGKHNQNSLAKDLLERESNVVLFDEFDKPHPVFHSAFYQLFDEGIYSDRNFTVQMKDSIIICTSNYLSESEIKKALGEPIFSRFDAVIKFDKLSRDSIERIIIKEYESEYGKLEEEEKIIVEQTGVKDRVLSLAGRLNNARQIRKIIREAMSSVLVAHFL